MNPSFIDTNAFYTANRLFDYNNSTINCTVTVLENNILRAKFSDSFTFERYTESITIFSNAFYENKGKVNTQESIIRYEVIENTLIIKFKKKTFKIKYECKKTPSI